jgi:hypothetical protein
MTQFGVKRMSSLYRMRCLRSVRVRKPEHSDPNLYIEKPISKEKPENLHKKLNNEAGK